MEVKSLHSLIVQNQAAQKASQVENIQHAAPNVDFTERFSEGLNEVARAQIMPPNLQKHMNLEQRLIWQKSWLRSRFHHLVSK